MRFTQSKDGSSFYAITLGWPEREFTVRSLQATANAGPGRVELLGFGPVSHRFNAENQIVVSLPAKRPGDHAFAFKFTGFKTALHPSARFEQPDVIRLEPAQATCARERREAQYRLLGRCDRSPALACRRKNGRALHIAR